ncbi:MAG: glycosyltransferase family 2 protein [Candidatus Omnitrophica bacterium]|nr:glycosyltransferase family 2 protein [Candidatus Omnitrophota bacterium]
MLSVIVPVYNEDRTLAEVVSKLLSLNIDKQIIIVNDGSSDSTHREIAKFSGIENIAVINIKQNRGKGNAIRQGLKEAKGEIVAIQDADLEYNPDDLIRLAGILTEKRAQVVYGCRFCSDSETPLWHEIGNRILSILSSIIYFRWVKDMETCYKIMYLENWKALDLKSDRFEVEAEITAKVLKNRFKLIQEPISYKFRSFKDGKKISWKDGARSVFVLLKYRFLC